MILDFNNGLGGKLLKSLLERGCVDMFLKRAEYVLITSQSLNLANLLTLARSGTFGHTHTVNSEAMGSGLTGLFHIILSYIVNNILSIIYCQLILIFNSSPHFLPPQAPPEA